MTRLTTDLAARPHWTADQQHALSQRLGEQIQALWFAAKQAVTQLKARLAG